MEMKDKITGGGPSLGRDEDVVGATLPTRLFDLNPLHICETRRWSWICVFSLRTAEGHKDVV
ncbi:uncharacterized protein ACO6RY_13902 [Pungitius sinensis]